MKDKIIKTSIPIFWLLIILLIGLFIGTLIGIMIGMVAQQMILFKGIETIAPAFSGVEVNIDLNETAIIDGLAQVASDIRQTYGDPHNINIDATCPGRNTTKTTVECIQEIEARAKYNIEVNGCTGSLCGYM